MDAPQWAIVITTQPVRYGSRLLYFVGFLLGRIDLLILHGPYWAVVRARRRLKGAPIWQPHDIQIGIGPPCDHCGLKNSPPEHHRLDCDFWNGPPGPEGRALSPDVIEELAKRDEGPR